MSTASQSAAVVRAILLRPNGGVVGLVDDLLKVCQAHSLQIDWRADRCRVIPPAGELEETIDNPVRKSVFRAVLTRLATLCNERRPDSVSPFGGRGMVPVGCDVRRSCRVAFENTPDRQGVELTI